MTHPDMGYETPPLTHFLVADYGVFFLDANDELIFGHQAYGQTFDPNDMPAPRTVAEALALTEGEECLVDVIDLSASSEAEYASLLVWLELHGAKAWLERAPELRASGDDLSL